MAAKRKSFTDSGATMFRLRDRVIRNDADIRKRPISRTSRKDLNILPSDQQTSSRVTIRLTSTRPKIETGYSVLRTQHELGLPKKEADSACVHVWRSICFDNTSFGEKTTTAINHYGLATVRIDLFVQPVEDGSALSNVHRHTTTPHAPPCSQRVSSPPAEISR